jgi:two-component system, NarL family, nitrate/nitrite response regulator NarL
MTAPEPVSDVVPIRILMVEDYPLIASAMAQVLATLPGVSVIGVVDSCAGALAAVAEHRPDVMLLDQRLPDGLGTDVLPGLLAEHPQMKVLLVTGVDSDDVVLAAIDRGAAGVISKTSRLNALVKAIRAAAEDDAVMDADVLRRLLPRLLPRETTTGTDLTVDFTEQDRKVLGLLVDGLSTAALAKELGVAPATAREYVRAVMSKLGAQSRLEAIAIAVREHVAVMS